MTVVGVLLNLQRYVIPVWLPMMVAAGRLPYGALAAGLAGWILWTYVGTRVGPGRLRSVLLAAAFSLTLASCLALRETFPWSSISLVIAVCVCAYLRRRGVHWVRQVIQAAHAARDGAGRLPR